MQDLNDQNPHKNYRRILIILSLLFLEGNTPKRLTNLPKSLR